MTYNKFRVSDVYPDYYVDVDTTGAVSVIQDGTDVVLIHYEIDFDYIELNGDYTYERSEENGVVSITFKDWEGTLMAAVDAYIEEAQDA